VMLLAVTSIWPLYACNAETVLLSGEIMGAVSSKKKSRRTA
jgi:hypothetical protein